MRVFISEYLTSGALSEPPSGSLAVEGRAMAEAMLCDAARLPDCRIQTTWDARLEPPVLGEAEIEVRPVTAPHEALAAFRELAAESDRVLVIAPEFDGLLAARCRVLEAAGGRSAGCTSDAIDLCADKLELARRLHAAGVRTPKTVAFEAASERLPSSGPFVVKRRDGAGSDFVRFVSDEDRQATFHKRAAEAIADGLSLVLQPFVAGSAASAAAVIDDAGRMQIWPWCRQRLTEDGRFRYLGGEIVSTVHSWAASLQPSVERLVRQSAESISGLRGYVGFDFVFPTDSPDLPVLIEINPRLTTSYLGYRLLADENLAARVLEMDCVEAAPRWRRGRISFRIG
ncbi:MAG: ATP-grasp domain-containing protein [Planctomycetes bacterium]|nr:ATP-grasp domain-containing protein [Planctomycetota bacterium]